MNTLFWINTPPAVLRSSLSRERDMNHAETVAWRDFLTVARSCAYAYNTLRRTRVMSRFTSGVSKRGVLPELVSYHQMMPDEQHALLELVYTVRA